MLNQAVAANNIRVIEGDRNRAWGGLYRTGAIASLISLVFFPAQIAIFFTNPYPTDIQGWFALLANKPLVGMVELDLFLVIDEILVLLIFLALFAALREKNSSVMLWATTFGLASVVLFITSNPVFAMLSLSDQFALAATEAQRLSLISAGQAVMSIWNGSGFETAYIIGSISPIAISIIMLQSTAFKKTTAWLGIVSNVIALGKYVPVVGIYISIFSVVLLWAWYLFMAIDLFKLAKLNPGGAR